MEYYQILGLKKEPFSNSPEPEFFCHTPQHRGCLQQLELAIRLRRGLNVVMGEVGTGKTTLCRQLILTLESFNKEGKVFEVQLVLDPDFPSSLEFIKAVARGFGITWDDQNITEWQLKDKIKGHLFQRGVEEDRIVVLIIDEGQKMPAYVMETLREFLNYETNEYKLLQIVIFAQKEFSYLLKDHPNFADRVNQFISLEPLNFKQTKNLIRSRLELASGNGLPELISRPAYLAIWRFTGGYPRKIISLLHQLLLAMIIQNKTKVTRSLVLACARRVSMERPRRTYGWLWMLVILLGVGLATESYAPGLIYQNLVSITERFSGRTGQDVPSSPQPPPEASPSTVSPGVEKSMTEKAVLSRARATQDPGQPPTTLGSLRVEKNETLSHILYLVYGHLTNERLQALARSNPQLYDLDYVVAGTRINLPALPALTTPPVEKTYWVVIKGGDSLEAARELLKEYRDRLPAARLFPYWNRREGMVYAVVLKEPFYDELTANKVLERLPPSLAGQARVVNKWEGDTVFYAAF